MNKSLKMILIFLILVIAMQVYNYVYIDVSKKQQQLFINYFTSHIAQLQDYYVKTNNEKNQTDTLNLELNMDQNDIFKFSFKLNEQIIKNIIDKYGEKLIQLFEENNCTVEEFVEVELNGEIQLADKFKLTANEKQFISKITTRIKEFLEDPEVLKICDEVVSKEQIQNLKDTNEKYIQKIEKIDENSEINIAVYVKDGKPVRTDFISEEEQYSYQIIDIENKKIPQFSVKQKDYKESFVLISEISNENKMNLTISSKEFYITCQASVDEEIETEVDV